MSNSGEPGVETDVDTIEDLKLVIERMVESHDKLRKKLERKERGLAFVEVLLKKYPNLYPYELERALEYMDSKEKSQKAYDALYEETKMLRHEIRSLQAKNTHLRIKLEKGEIDV
jgi:hypothetical protein